MTRLHKSLTGIEAREAYFKGADSVAKIVRESIGPFGLNLAMEKGKKTTNDGFLISRELSASIPDEFERQGALLQHEASSKTNDKVADATSTTIALTSEIRKEIIKHLPTKTRFVSTKSVTQLEQELKKERDFVLEELKQGIKTIDSKEELIASAKVSVEDEELAQLIGGTQWDLGADGRIVPEEVNEDESSVEITSGILVDNGFVSSLMINNEQEQALEVSNGKILLTNYTIGEKEFPALSSLITLLASTGETKLVIMARAFTQETIKILMGLRQSGFECYPVNAPYTDQAQVMKDIEAVTNAIYLDQDISTWDDVSLSHLGEFSKIKMRIMGGIITGKVDKPEKVEARIKQLEDTLSAEKSFFYKTRLEERIADLRGKKALLKIGGYVQDDRARLKDKADDAVVSVRLALKGGTVKGAGLAFKEIADKLDDKSLLKRPLQVVYNQIMTSAPEGFKIEDWVRDPYLTLETALINACESAISMARINGSVVQRDQRPKDQSYEDENK